MNTIGIKKNSYRATLFIAIMSIYVLSCVSNIFSGGISRGIQVFTIMMLFVMFDNHNNSKYTSKIFLDVTIFSLYVFFYRAIDYSKAGWGNVLMQISFFSAILATIYTIIRLDTSRGSILYYIIFSILSFVLFQDVFLFRTYNYSRIASFSEMEEMGSNVRWTSFSTMILYLYSVCLLVFLNHNRMIVKIIHVAIMLLSFYYIIFCSMRGTISILLLMVTTMLFYMKFKNRNSFFKYFSIILMLSLVVALVIDTNTIFDFLISISPGDRLASRVRDLQTVYNEGLTEDSLSGRYYLEMISIQSWLDNPFSFLFGIGDQRNSEFGVLGFIKSGVGGHSEIIDSLARFGMVGFSIIIVLYYRIYHYIVSLFDSPIVKKQVKVILILFILTALSKAVLYHITGIAIFIMIPISSLIINKNRL